MVIKVLLGCTGSVASVKVPLLVEGLQKHGYEVKVVATEKAQHFFSQTHLNVEMLRDEDEWKAWQQLSDPVLHIELRRWADILVIAPLDANTLAKITHGICDNLLTCVVRAWDLKRPLLFAPAMNTHMWDHPITKQQVDGLKAFGYIEIPVVEKKLACGDIGFGAMAEVATILEYVHKSAEAVGTT
ncbi:hypothetical protein ACJMK2_044152 [Sinanodonta woodiana]|uniref:Phosphopantothenoylcysteine decarboxylase n=1 Tax=Sinanodonta woodiana TaxID=1069815 RepID=A0ABD3W2B9_SINWO